MNILELSKKTDIDAYFAMHDALNEVLKIKRNQTSEKNITAKVERVLNPEKYNQAPLVNLQENSKTTLNILSDHYI